MRAIALRGLAPTPAPPEVLYGHVTLENFRDVTGRSYHDESIRVTLDGEEVDRVAELDDIAGWVACYELNPSSGHLHAVLKYGAVRLTFVDRL